MNDQPDREIMLILREIGDGRVAANQELAERSCSLFVSGVSNIGTNSSEQIEIS